MRFDLFCGMPQSRSGGCLKTNAGIPSTSLTARPCRLSRDLALGLWKGRSPSAHPILLSMMREWNAPVARAQTTAFLPGRRGAKIHRSSNELRSMRYTRWFLNMPHVRVKWRWKNHELALPCSQVDSWFVDVIANLRSAGQGRSTDRSSDFVSAGIQIQHKGK